MAKEIKKKPLKKGQASFNLIGEAKINDFTFKLNESARESDWVYNQLNLGVDCGNGNTVYCEMMGGYGSERDNVLYVHGTKKNDNGKTVDDFENRFEIAWEDRFEDDVLETIGDMCFITVGLEKDKKDKTFTKKFLSAYDAIDYINNNLESGTVVNVKGDLKYSIYNDNVQVRKEIKSIFLSKADDTSKYKAVFTQTVLLDRDSLGKLDKEKASYPIYAKVVDYAKNYNNKEVKTNVPFAKVFEFEVDKEKPENTKKFIDKYIKVKNGITEITFEGDIIEGQALVNISEDDLPEDIKELIDMGVYTLEEAVNKCAVGNTKEKRMVIRKPAIKVVGEDDNKVPVIQMTPNQYEEDDLYFAFMYATDDEDEDKDSNTSTRSNKSKSKAGNKTKSKKDDEDSEEDTSWLDALVDDDDLPF